MRKVLLSSLFFLLATASTLTFAGSPYIGYDASFLTIDTKWQEKVGVVNNLKVGYLLDSNTTVRFGTEAVFNLMPSTSLYTGNDTRGTFRYAGGNLLGLADITLSKNWHATFRAGLGLDHVELSGPQLVETDKSNTLNALIGFGLYWNITKQLDLGITSMFRSSNLDLNKSSVDVNGWSYSLLGFNYYFKR